jgi:5'-deoxynucleotidase YfbR-like HD superfamily hydrolase
MKLVKMFGALSGLSGTYRFSNAKLSNPESVLEHTGAVVLTCYFLVSEMKTIDHIPSLSLGLVLSRAAIHDVEELITGDVPRTTKYSSAVARDALKRLEVWGMERIVHEMDLQSRATVIDDHHYAKTGEAGVIVEIADILAVVYKLYEEVVERGNRSMLSRSTSCISQIKKVTGRVNHDSISWPPPVKEFLRDVLHQAMEIVIEAEKHASPFMISEEPNG